MCDNDEMLAALVSCWIKTLLYRLVQEPGFHYSFCVPRALVECSRQITYFNVLLIISFENIIHLLDTDLRHHRPIKDGTDINVWHPETIVKFQ